MSVKDRLKAAANGKYGEHEPSSAIRATVNSPLTGHIQLMSSSVQQIPSRIVTTDLQWGAQLTLRFPARNYECSTCAAALPGTAAAAKMTPLPGQIVEAEQGRTLCHTVCGQVQPAFVAAEHRMPCMPCCVLPCSCGWWHLTDTPWRGQEHHHSGAVPGTWSILEQKGTCRQAALTLCCV